MASIEMPLVCQAGPAAEAFVGSLHVVKNTLSVCKLCTCCQSFCLVRYHRKSSCIIEQSGS